VSASAPRAVPATYGLYRSTRSTFPNRLGLLFGFEGPSPKRLGSLKEKKLYRDSPLGL
jgi:hypothetical protein